MLYPRPKRINRAPKAHKMRDADDVVVCKIKYPKKFEVYFSDSGVIGQYVRIGSALSLVSLVVELIGKALNFGLHYQFIKPVLGNACYAIIGSGNLTAHGGRGIGVVAEVSGHKNCVTIGAGVEKAPQRRLQAGNYIAGAFNFVV